MMRLTCLPIALLAGVAGCATAATQEAQGPDPRVTAAIAGKVAGKPQSCIPLSEASGSELVRDAIIYRVGRTRLWLADAPGCGSSGTSDDILVQRVYGSQLCRGDIVRQVDRVSGIGGGACAIRSFTPYTTPKR